MTEEADRTDRIRARAYRIWESEGRPDDRAEIHWSIASRIVDEEEAADRAGRPRDDVEEASWESFPASDPPAIVQPIKSVRHGNGQKPANDGLPVAANRRKARTA
jgi:hypothetical protein